MSRARFVTKGFGLASPRRTEQRRWLGFETDARGLVDRTMAMRFLWVGGGVALFGALISAFEAFALTAQARTVLVGSQALLGLLCLGAVRLVDRVPHRRLVLLGAWACVAVVTIIAVVLGHGAHSLDLSFYPLVICVLAALVGTGSALALTLACAGIVAALAWAETQGLVPGAAVLGLSPLSHPLSTHGLLLVAGFTVGAILLRLSNTSYREAKDREARFRGLLAIATQQYWETDAQLRLQRYDDSATLEPSPLMDAWLQRPLAQTIADLAIDPHGREAALQALAARQPFDQLRLRLAPGHAVVQLSGQPRHDAQGAFVGYWGVAADISEAERTRLEHAAMLQRAPVGIAFTRHRRVIGANPHFERMFGWPGGSMVGGGPEVTGATKEECEALESLFARNAAHGQAQVIEARMTRRDGSRFWCRLQADSLDTDEASNSGTIWIAEDVTERRQAQRELADARDAAEAASRAKSQFLANTSHEIRTPLNALLGLARLALAEGCSEAQRRTYLRHIQDSARGLSAIISDILDLSKIEAGKLELEAAPFDLRGVLQAVQQTYLPLAQAKGLGLELAVETTLPAAVQGDSTRVRQIVGNFVANGIKFTERGQVRVEARELAPGRVQLAVQDSGIGIDPQAQHDLFTPFSQADASTTRRYGGTGLGLSICRQLARQMGGEVGVHSKPGEGSRFWAELPLPACEPAAVAATAGAAPGEEPGETEALQGARVLVAEDNVVNMLITVTLLQAWGVQVTEAPDGAMAREAVLAAARAGRPFDAVLMDVQMPVLGGHEAARALRDALGDDAPPLIALTAAAMVGERELALRSGMSDFLTKPLEPERMRTVLARWVRQGRGLRAARD
ncbi:MAG: response regulator [Rubrivivax sp.]|nr:response regulator [Rubrivivax sp.]